MTDQNVANGNSLFTETNAKFGLQGDFNNFSLDGSSNESVVFSGDLSISSFSPSIHKVNQIGELKCLIGSDLSSDQFVVYPKPFTNTYQEILDAIKEGKSITDLLTKSVKDNLDIAYAAYLNGDTAKVSDYVELLEAIYFPLKLAYFATKDTMVVSQDITVSGEDPVVLNCNGIKFSGTSGISSETQLTVISETMIK